MQDNLFSNLLTKERIMFLEQNYIKNNSAIFVTKLNEMHSKAIDDIFYIDPLNVEKRKDFSELYSIASTITATSLPYAKLTTFIFQNKSIGDATAGFIGELEQFYKEKFNQMKSEQTLTENDFQAISVLAKTVEHLNLALSQKNSLYIEQKDELDDIKKELKDEKMILKDLRSQNKAFNSTLKESLTTIEELTNNTSEYKTKYEKMTVDYLSMMGVFSTIIFAVFGGLSQIGAVGTKLPQTPIPKLLMYISLSSIALLLVIFISFNAVSRLTNQKFSSCDCPPNSEDCSHKIYQQHPLFSFGIFFFMDLFMLSLILRAFDETSWYRQLKNLSLNIHHLNLGNITASIVVTIFIAINIIVAFYLIKNLRLKKKTSNSTSSNSQ